MRHLPKVIHRIQSQGKTGRQVFITTHSEALLSDHSIPPEEVLRLVTTPSGTEIKAPDPQEKIMFASGMNAAEVLLPSVRPSLEIFIVNHWSTERSAERAPSLARARRRISILADEVASS